MDEGWMVPSDDEGEAQVSDTGYLACTNCFIISMNCSWI